ncbi:MAG: hypothetical protein V3R57_08080 [Candidatus Bathyarchaeia archaeon]
MYRRELLGDLVRLTYEAINVNRNFLFRTDCIVRGKSTQGEIQVASKTTVTPTSTRHRL